MRRTTILAAALALTLLGCPDRGSAPQQPPPPAKPEWKEPDVSPPATGTDKPASQPASQPTGG